MLLPHVNNFYCLLRPIKYSISVYGCILGYTKAFYFGLSQVSILRNAHQRFDYICFAVMTDGHFKDCCWPIISNFEARNVETRLFSYHLVLHQFLNEM